MKKILLQTGSILIAIIMALFIGKAIKQNRSKNAELDIIYPFNNALFPPEFPAPTFEWIDKTSTINKWIVELRTKDNKYVIFDTLNISKWRPNDTAWNSIKSLASSKGIEFTISQLVEIQNEQVSKNTQKLNLFISDDEVGAPILYREIPLPFAYAEQNPEKMSYRLLDPGSTEPPHFAMKKFMVCGNCHSFSNDGKTIGLDFDAAKRDKGGYFIADITDSVIFDTSTYLSWNKLQDRPTFGMFSKLSPDGRYILTTIKDRVVSENFGYSPEVIPFSQLFFPVNGVLAVYDRVADSLWELEGANLDGFVQSNAFWAPDGKTIVFARAEALPYGENSDEIKVNDLKVINDYVNRKAHFKFDIYTIPFNNGKGGRAKALKGASENGMSNYFPTISPDGKWIVFCQAESFMLLQPDSRLFIVPFNGGKAKQLKCNLPTMNSWHAWSPNSKWIVYSSKGLSYYTDLFLTHINEKGHASIPVLIEKSRVKGMAVNYPEFVNIEPNKKFDMVYKYVTIDHILLALNGGDTELAKSLYQDYIKQDQYSLISEYLFLMDFNIRFENYAEASKFVALILAKDSSNLQANYYARIIKSKMGH